MTRVGLISDTHGWLREQAVEALGGSELIIHAGDIGNPEILQTLRELAPVVAVRGNIDEVPPTADLPETAIVELGPVSIFVLHDLKALKLNPATAGFRIVVSGHSHKPARTERGGVWYINPGSAGPRRFQLPLTVARLDLAKRPWDLQFIELLSSRPFQIR